MSYTTSLDLSLKVLSLSGEKEVFRLHLLGVKLNIFNFMSAIGRVDACNWVKYIYTDVYKITDIHTLNTCSTRSLSFLQSGVWSVLSEGLLNRILLR